MKILQPLPILALIICLPVTGSAQIVFERLNQGDPPAPVVDREQDDSETKAGEEPAGFTDDEVKQIRAVLTAQLQQTHTKCMGADEIRRPGAASISGTASWAVDAEGNAKFKSTSCNVSPDMYLPAEEQSRLTDLVRQDLQRRANELYNECAKGADVQVPVQGKSGDVTLKFTVTWSNNKTVVNVQDR